MNSKRGLSAVVTTLLIILLAMVAVGAVWIVVSNLISEGSKDINLAQFTLDMAIKSAYVDTADLDNIKVRVRRSAGKGDLRGLNFVFSDGSNSIVIRRDIILNQLEERTFIFSSTEISGIGAGDEVSVAPIFDSSGSEKIGEITDTEKISSTVPPGGGEGEDPPGGGDPGTGYCGDGTVQYPNGEEPPINELCDLSDLNGQDCTSLGLGTGTPLCTASCQFDTSPCSEGTPSSCGDGTWDADGDDDIPGNADDEECEGGTKCEASCTCPIGYESDGIGGCKALPSLDYGTINSVWPSGAVKYFDSPGLPLDTTEMQSFMGKYVNFSNAGGGTELNCMKISYAEFLSIEGISYVRVEFVSNILPGDNYEVWEAEDCNYPL